MSAKDMKNSVRITGKPTDPLPTSVPAPTPVAHSATQVWQNYDGTFGVNCVGTRDHVINELEAAIQLLRRTR